MGPIDARMAGDMFRHSAVPGNHDVVEMGLEYPLDNPAGEVC